MGYRPTASDRTTQAQKNAQIYVQNGHELMSHSSKQSKTI